MSKTCGSLMKKLPTVWSNWAGKNLTIRQAIMRCKHTNKGGRKKKQQQNKQAWLYQIKCKNNCLRYKPPWPCFWKGGRISIWLRKTSNLKYSTLFLINQSIVIDVSNIFSWLAKTKQTLCENNYYLIYIIYGALYGASLRNCINGVHNCEDHLSLDFISAVQIWFISYTSFAFISFTGTYEPTIDLLPTSFWQLVRASHRYHKVTGSNPIEVLNFFQASLCNCINCIHNCKDHLSLDFISTVQIWFISYTSFLYCIN